MADHYTQYSFEVSGISADEGAWWTLLIEYAEQINEGKAVEDPRFSELNAIDWSDREYLSLGHIELQADGDVWLADDAGSGEPNHLAEALRAFLATFRPFEMIGFEWANTCSKPRLDSFGGGAALVDAQDIIWYNPSQMLAEAMAARA